MVKKAKAKKIEKKSVKIVNKELKVVEKPVEKETNTAIVKATLMGEKVITEDSDLAREYYDKGRYGSVVNGKVEMGIIEALYLVDKGKLEMVNESGKKIDMQTFLKKAKKNDKHFWVRYSVYKDIRNRGYIIKTALKFGADFRVYDRGIKPGEDHAKWVVFPVHETSVLTWHDFSAKNRVAHSTRKRLLLGIVDEEGDVSYWESRWIRP